MTPVVVLIYFKILRRVSGRFPEYWKTTCVPTENRYSVLPPIHLRNYSYLVYGTLKQPDFRFQQYSTRYTGISKATRNSKKSTVKINYSGVCTRVVRVPGREVEYNDQSIHTVQVQAVDFGKALMWLFYLLYVSADS